MFPPSDSHFADDLPEHQPSDRSPSGGLALEDRRVPDALIPTNGGRLSEPAEMPWSIALPPVRPEILTAKPDFNNLLHALRRRKWLVMFLGILCGGGLGAAAWFLLPTKYESGAILEVRDAKTLMLDNQGADSNTVAMNAISQIKNSPVVLNKALDEPTVRDQPLIKRAGVIDPQTWLSDNLILTNLGGGIVKVAIRGEEPQGLQEIVTAVIGAYKQEVVDKERSEKFARHDKLEQLIKDAKNQLLELKRQQYTLGNEVGATDAASARIAFKLAQETLEQSMRDRLDMQKKVGELSMNRDLYKLMKEKAENGNVPEDKLEEAIAKDPSMIQANNDRATLQRQLREANGAYRYNTKDPNVLRLKDQLRSLDQGIEQMRTAIRDALIKQYKEQGDLQSNEMKGLEVQIDFLKKKLEDSLPDINKQAKKVQDLDKFNGEWDQIRNDIETKNSFIRTMEDQLERSTVELSADPRIIIHDANTAHQTEPWRQYLLAGFGGFLGFGLVLVGVTFFEFLSRRLSSAHEVTEGLGIKVVGDLPTLSRGRLGFRMRSRRALHGLVAESINGIRATVVREGEPGVCQTLLITSAGESEGKTTVASQLAASLARSGRRTLLLDGDLRHPGANHVFNMPNEHGFCELLRGEIGVEDAIRATPADNLWMITAGRCDAQAVLGLGKDVVGDIFADLGSRFDFIVIDTGPVLKVADALLLGQHADGAILSVLRDVSQIHKVHEASERLKLVGMKVIGAVINGSVSGGAFDRYHVESPAA